jgi:hypothetical protein
MPMSPGLVVRLGALAMLVFISLPSAAAAATLSVCASGCAYADLQAAIDAARPGDVIQLRGGETYVGHFVLTPKDNPTGTPIVIRTADSGTTLPGSGVRLVPDGYPGANVPRSALARLVGRGGQWRTTPVIAAAPGAGHYRLELLDIDGINQQGYYTLLEIGTNSSLQSTLSAVPYNIVFDRVFVHGHPTKGQQRCIGLNGRDVEILNSFVVDCKSFAVDAQAIGTFNSPGPIKIVNNYLEGTTENVMIGGADPRIDGLVPSDILISRNHFSKPVSWQSPILAAPAGAPSAFAEGGGALPGGTYYFTVVAVLEAGGDLAFSAPSPERAAGVPGGGRVSLSWAAVEGADRYRVYAGTSSGGQNRYMETSGPETTLSYTGSGEGWESPPRQGTKWNVKNLLEFKNAQRVTIDGNLFEHMWPASQSGYAILLTPRNEEGTAPWSVVQDITMTNNIIRHVSGVLNILGHDDIRPSQQTSRITFRNNLVYDVSSAWGGSSHFAVITSSPASLTFDHNTIFMEGMLVLADDGASYGLTFTNNLAPHNDYGFYGSGAGVGSAALQAYFPDAVFRRNALGGGPASAYPADNFFPDLATFRSQFVNVDGSDFNLVAGSTFRGTGTDGKDLGVDYAALSAATVGVVSGSPTGGGTGGSGGGGDTGGGSDPGGGSGPGTGGGSTPFGTAVALPGLIEAENFDEGGVGVAYQDTTGGNAGGQYRSVDVDIEGTSDTNGGFNVGWITTGEWLRYSVSVANAGTYDLQFRVASEGRGGTFHIEVNGADITGPISVPDTGGWQAWTTVTKAGVALSAGSQVWTLVVDTATNGIVGNINYIRVTAPGGGGTGTSTTPYHGSPVALPGTLQAEDFDNGGGGSAYLDTTGGNSGGAYRSTDVDIEPASEGGHNVGWALAGEFLRYTVNVASAGTYELEFRVASEGSGGTFHLEVNGADVTGALSVPNTGGWQTWATVRKSVALPAGQQAWRLVLDADGASGGVGNFDWIRVSGGSGGTTPPPPSGGTDIVLYASDVTSSTGNWARVGSWSGAGGEKMQSQDWGWSSTDQALASPDHYFEARFVPEAGRLYRVWIRLRGGDDSKWNDSLWLQFSNALNSGGAAVWGIGSTSGLLVNLEPCSNCGVSDWGWSSGSWWLGDQSFVKFSSGAEQRVRVQIREDGVEVDQIVLSPVTYFDRAPGPAVNDSTIVPKR